MSILLPIFTAFTLTVIFTKLALKMFPKWGLMDKPAKYGLTRAPIPYFGGTVIYLVFLISLLVFLPIDKL